MPEISIQTSNGAVKTVSLTGGRLTVGRSSLVELCFADDWGLSRQHFAFEPEGDSWRVQDLGSKNGTFVNNTPLKVPLILKPGDRITAGHLLIVYEPSIEDRQSNISFFRSQGHIGNVAKYRKDIRSYRLDERPFAFGRASALYEGVGKDGEAICVKLYHKTKSIYVDEFARELIALQTLNHPNILPVLEFGIDITDSPFIVLPMCKGGDLRQLLQGGKAYLPVAEALPLLTQVAEALDFAHKKGFIHGDVKPENILRSEGVHTYLSDFGVSRHITIQEHFSAGATTVSAAEDSRGGSTAYLSPEQINENRQTPLSDIYSFALVAYELLTGLLPFDTRLPPFKQMQQKVAGVLIDPRRANCLLSKGAADVLLKGLEADESRRLSSATDLCTDLAKSEQIASLSPNPTKMQTWSSDKPQTKGTRLFISYSRVDRKWVDRIRVHLQPLERMGLIDLWSDDKIKPGEIWQRQLDEAIASSKIALIIISASYLASNYIANEELPALLLKAKAAGLVVLSIIVSPCRYDEDHSLFQFQALNDPTRTLVEMDRGEAERVLASMASHVAELLNA